jgi:hypothetical protein
MKWILQGQEQEVNKNIDDIKKAFQIVEEQYKQQNLFIDYLEVDGMQVYDNFEGYLFEQDAQKVDFHFATIELLQIELVKSIRDYLGQARSVVRDLADSLYRTPDQQLWKDFELFIEALEWLQSAILKLISSSNEEDLNNFAEIHTNLSEKIEELDHALTDTDIILVADLIKYEILQIFDSMKEQCDIFIKQKEVAYDVRK